MLCGACAVRGAVRRSVLRRGLAGGSGETSTGGAGASGAGASGDSTSGASTSGASTSGAGTSGVGTGGASTGASPLRRLVRAARAGTGPGSGESGWHWHTAPYAAPQRGLERRGEAPQDTTVLLFPGQGSQYVGMGLKLKDVPAARELYDLASNILGWDVWQVCTAGPESELSARAQECVVVSSLAALEAAREVRPGAVGRVRAVAGYSAGQLAALVWAGALALEPALRVLAVRAAAMRACAAARPGGMLCVWAPPGLDVAGWAARTAAAAGGAAWLAARLYPGCRVVAADEAGLAALEAGARAAGLRRHQRLPVGGPWHCALMAGSVAPVRAALRAAGVRPPRVTTVCCVSAKPLRSAAAVERSLATLAARPLSWEAALHCLYARPRSLPQPLTLALGPGAAMRSMLRQVNARAWDCSLQIDV